jgi:hypothetical protein
MKKWGEKEIGEVEEWSLLVAYHNHNHNHKMKIGEIKKSRFGEMEACSQACLLITLAIAITLAMT